MAGCDCLRIEGSGATRDAAAAESRGWRFEYCEGLAGAKVVGVEVSGPMLGRAESGDATESEGVSRGNRTGEAAEVSVSPCISFVE